MTSKTTEPAEYDEFADVETWEQGSLEYPIPGQWDLDDHGRFHTKWEHDDGTVLTRSWGTGTDRETYIFRIDGEDIYSDTASPDRAQMREDTVRLLRYYDDNAPITAAEFRTHQQEHKNASLGDF